MAASASMPDNSAVLMPPALVVGGLYDLEETYNQRLGGRALHQIEGQSLIHKAAIPLFRTLVYRQA